MKINIMLLRLVRVSFDELQDAPPSGKFRLSITGKLGVIVVAFWLFIAIFGQFLAPYEENDLPFPDDYSEFQKPDQVLG